MNLTLRERIAEGNNVYSFIFDSDKPVKWQAGQFMRYRLRHDVPDERGETRYFTISSAPFEKKLRLTTRFASERGSSFKQALLNLQPESQVEATGPNGSFVIEDPNQKYVFIAGGIGITPFRSILLQLNHDHKPINITLLYANRVADVTFNTELGALTPSNHNFKIEYVIEPQRIDTGVIQAKVPDYQERIFYVSGPEPMVEAMDKVLSGMGVPEQKVMNDFFPNYSWP